MFRKMLEMIKNIKRKIINNSKLIQIVIVPLLASILPIVLPTKVFNYSYYLLFITGIYNLKSKKEMFAAFVLIVMCLYWMLECLPLAVTSLLPIVFFPLFSILSSGETTQIYFRVCTLFEQLGFYFIFKMKNSLNIFFYLRIFKCKICSIF